MKQAYEKMVLILISDPDQATQADYVTDEKIHIVEGESEESEI